MKDSFYVDDSISGEQSSEKAFLLYEQASEGLQTEDRSGLISNSKELLRRIEETEEKTCTCKRDVSDDETYHKVSMGVNNNSDTSEKVLGMSWDCESDKFIIF